MGTVGTSKLWGPKFDPELELLCVISVYVLPSWVSSWFSRFLPYLKEPVDYTKLPLGVTVFAIQGVFPPRVQCS